MHEKDDKDAFPVAKLLRLKRYEEPPPEYFKKFLCEFQRRQRAELLRRPAWRIALEQLFQRLQGMLTASQFSYATASIAVLAVAGLMTFQILQHPGGSLVATTASSHPAVASVASASTSGGLALNSSALAAQPQSFAPPQTRTVQAGAFSQRPRYILDTRPVSYEAPSRF